MLILSSLTALAMLPSDPPAIADTDPSASAPSVVETMEQRAATMFGPHADTHDLSGTFMVDAGGTIGVAFFGQADADGAAHDLATRYHFASITKGVMAAGIVTLQRDRLLDLDDPVGRHLPALADRPDLTIRSVMRHRAGLPCDFPESLDATTLDVAAWLVADPERLLPVGRKPIPTSATACWPSWPRR